MLVGEATRISITGQITGLYCHGFAAFLPSDKHLSPDNPCSIEAQPTVLAEHHLAGLPTPA